MIGHIFTWTGDHDKRDQKLNVSRWPKYSATEHWAHYWIKLNGHRNSILNVILNNGLLSNDYLFWPIFFRFFSFALSESLAHSRITNKTKWLLGNFSQDKTAMFVDQQAFVREWKEFSVLPFFRSFIFVFGQSRDIWLSKTIAYFIYSRLHRRYQNTSACFFVQSPLFDCAKGAVCVIQRAWITPNERKREALYCSFFDFFYLINRFRQTYIFVPELL